MSPYKSSDASGGGVFQILMCLLLGHSGLLLHTRGITGKRERESEREGSGEKDAASCSMHKMQRQSAEVRIRLIVMPTVFNARESHFHGPIQTVVMIDYGKCGLMLVFYVLFDR